MDERSSHEISLGAERSREFGIFLVFCDCRHLEDS